MLILIYKIHMIGVNDLLYIPILKTRPEELRLVANLNYCFSENIIPLFEIINDIYEPRYKVDPFTKKPVYEKRGKQNRKVLEPPTDDDIITLDQINDIVGGKTTLIDYFRYTLKKYGRRIDIQRVALSRRLNDDLSLYKKRTKEISSFKNLIPVVSIKDGFFMPKNELKSFLEDLKSENDQIALRITEEFINTYKELLEGVLRSCDFLLFDILEQNPELKFMEFDELREMDISAKIVLINSPRKSGINNGEYPENDYTDLINNCAKEKLSEHDFEGYGDYCGLKDQLPSSGGNGKGAAVAFIYDYNNNCFWTYTNKDQSQGVRGYKVLLPKIKADKPRFDSDDDCEGYKKINATECGNWGTWNNICATRYISQVFKYMA